MSAPNRRQSQSPDIRSTCREFDALRNVVRDALRARSIDTEAIIAQATSKASVVHPHWEDVPAGLLFVCLTFASLALAVAWIRSGQ